MINEYSKGIVLEQKLLEDLMIEIQDKYGMPKIAVNKILIECITKVYASDYPVILLDDGAYLVFGNDDKTLKYVKIKYSKQKTKKILDLIQVEANRYYLKMQLETVNDFIKLKKPYLHAQFTYSDGRYDYYDLFYDLSHGKIANNIKAYTHCNEAKKDRIFIDYTSVRYEKNNVFFKERKNINTRQNAIVVIKDICSEISKKTGKKIWINIKNIDENNKKLHLSVTTKTNKAIIEYIEKRVGEIFGLSVVFHMAKNDAPRVIK